MSKAFSVVSWNVRRFRHDPHRIPRIVKFLRSQNPDVFALYEVLGKQVFHVLTRLMPEYSFHITEGKQVQEILVGVKRNITAFFTQKTEFKSGVSLLRPGALLTVTVRRRDYSLLFLHTKSGNDPRGMGLRDDMLKRACRFRQVLDKMSRGRRRANFIFLGDLNTMGMKYPYRRSIQVEYELRKLNKHARTARMRVLRKTCDHTWCGGARTALPLSDLDHVVAADHLLFRKWGNKEVDVRGWPVSKTQLHRNRWIDRYSDHALLYLEVRDK